MSSFLKTFTLSLIPQLHNELAFPVTNLRRKIRAEHEDSLLGRSKFRRNNLSDFSGLKLNF